MRCEACGAPVPMQGGPCAVCPPEDAVAYVTVHAPSPRLRVRDTMELRARVVAEGGQELERPLEWSSTDPSVATVSPHGRVRARAPGHARIWATCDGQSKSVTLDVQRRATGRTLLRVAMLAVALTAAGAVASIRPDAPASPTDAAWVQSARPAVPRTASLSVLPRDSTVLQLGDQLALEAIPLDGDGRLVVGAPVAWWIDADTAVQVSPYGVATAVDRGRATVVATVPRPAVGDTLRAAVVIEVPGTGAEAPARAAVIPRPPAATPATPALERSDAATPATASPTGVEPGPAGGAPARVGPASPAVRPAGERPSASPPPPPPTPALAPESEKQLASASMSSAEARSAAGDYDASLVFYLAADNRLNGLEGDFPEDPAVSALRVEFAGSLEATLRACDALRQSDAVRGGAAFSCTYPPGDEDG